MSTLDRLSRDILAEYAAGKTITDMTAAGRPKDKATALIADVARFDRGRAREAVAAYDRGATVVAPAAAPVRPARPRQPAPPPPPEPADDEPEQIDTIADLLDVAAQSEVPRLVKLAARIREQIADLQVGVAAIARERELRAVLERHQAAAEQAAAALRELTGRTGPRSPRAEHPAKAVRRWAADSGVPCPTHGRIPQSVMDAYREATPAPTGDRDNTEQEQ